MLTIDQTKEQLAKEMKTWLSESRLRTFGDFLKTKLGWYPAYPEGPPAGTDLLPHEIIALRELAAERGKTGLFDRIQDEVKETQ